MTTLIRHQSCIDHEMGEGHPESPQRLAAIYAYLQQTGLWNELIHLDATEVTDAQLLGAHSSSHIERLQNLSPQSGYQSVDPDTVMNPFSLSAAKHAAGAGVQAVDLVLSGLEKVVFCAVRPPGHHAEYDRSMGFCLYNNIAVAAWHALKARSIDRVAIIDFDVHHGNGTVDIFKDDPRVMVCSSFQHPFYPNRYHDIVRDHIVLTPLPAGSTGSEFRKLVESAWYNALARHKPDLILVSAGFDAHSDDPLGGLCWLDNDYAWLGELTSAFAEKFCNGLLISFLEGGYSLSALARSAYRYLDAQHQWHIS